MKTFSHITYSGETPWERFVDDNIGRSVYNKYKSCRGVILDISPCSVPSARLCTGCESNGQVVIVRLENGTIANWCTSIWEGGNLNEYR